MGYRQWAYEQVLELPVAAGAPSFFQDGGVRVIG